MMKAWNMYIDGQWVDAEERIDVVNPATLDVIATVPKAKEKEAKAAVDAASAALTGWAAKTAAERSALLMNWFHLIDEQKEEIGRIMTTEQGKPLKEAIG